MMTPPLGLLIWNTTGPLDVDLPESGNANYWAGHIVLGRFVSTLSQRLLEYKVSTRRDSLELAHQLAWTLPNKSLGDSGT
jgi:hypothetical protein